MISKLINRVKLKRYKIYDRNRWQRQELINTEVEVGNDFQRRRWTLLFKKSLLHMQREDPLISMTAFRDSVSLLSQKHGRARNWRLCSSGRSCGEVKTDSHLMPAGSEVFNVGHRGKRQGHAGFDNLNNEEEEKLMDQRHIYRGEGVIWEIE